MKKQQRCTRGSGVGGTLRAWPDDRAALWAGLCLFSLIPFFLPSFGVGRETWGSGDGRICLSFSHPPRSRLTHALHLHRGNEATCDVTGAGSGADNTFYTLPKTSKKKICHNLIVICKSTKLASSAKKLNLRAVKRQGCPPGVSEVG